MRLISGLCITKVLLINGLDSRLLVLNGFRAGARASDLLNGVAIGSIGEDIMRISLDDIQVGDLNNVCVMLISKFARVLREHNGEVLRLRDKHVVREVAKHATQTENPELVILFMKLKVEMKNHLSQTAQRDAGFKGFLDLFKPDHWDQGASK